MATDTTIKAVDDAVTNHGLAKVLGAELLIVVVYHGVKYCVKYGIKYFIKKSEDKNHQQNKIKLEETKHKHRLEEARQKNELKKELIDHRQQKKQETTFNATVEVNPDDESASVQTYDEVVSGEFMPVDDLRLGLRCFHIGEDCGLIGRTQIGKTSWLLQYSMALARGSQEDHAKLSSDWQQSQPMTVLYFAFEQDQTFFRTKYGKVLKSVPNLYVEVKTNACDFVLIRQKILKMQSNVSDRRLLVVFDNITKMKCCSDKAKGEFFQWLESYRRECASKGTPITYLKVYHTQGKYNDSMPLDVTTNYGTKTDSFFTQSLVGFGMCKDGDGRMRYIKELKNKLEQDGEKQSLSLFKFADAEVPMFDYISEAEECDVLPTKANMVRGAGSTETMEPLKRGRKEKYTEEELRKVFEEHESGISWREIIERRGEKFSKNKKRALQESLKRHGFHHQ